ncbi:MAG TPA: YlxR family protein [Micromonospora sp.]
MVRRAWPVRTCVGCRQRAEVHELLRIVVAGDEPFYRLRPDPARSLPGRGAHLHPDPACLALAVRRRAFGRALRVAGVPDTSELAEQIERQPLRPTARSGEGTQRNVGKVGRPT